ncbi:MAG: TraC family protein [Candidatus Aenigmatarchaeota archaeon]
MLETLKRFIGLSSFIDEDESLRRSDLEALVRRNKFSKYLVYRAYDEENKFFYNADETIGFIFECISPPFLSETGVNVIKNLLCSPFPEGTVIQFILHADSNISPFLKEYVESKVKALSFVRKAYQHLAEFYSNSPYGMEVRDFRVYVAVKIPLEKVGIDMAKEIKANFKESLIGAGLACFEMTPSDLLLYLRLLLNGRINASVDEIKSLSGYCNYAPLNRQIINSETEIVREGKYLRINDVYFRCLTPKTLPPKADVFFGNYISGSFEGVSGDILQIGSPFFITYTVIIKDMKGEIHSKANLVLQQQSFGSFIVSLKRKIDEYIWAVASLEEGEKFFPVIITVWVYDRDKNKVNDSFYKALKIWERLGCVMQEETVLTLPLFVYSLPFNYVYDKKSFIFLDRHFILPSKVLSYMLPIQSDFRGTGEPVMLFVGRKGQIVGMDFFSPKSSNYNFFVAAPSGKGKSFLVNYIVSNYLGHGVKVRIVDIGRSYKKLCKMFGGKFLEFTKDSDICLNFFQGIRDPEYDIPVIVQIITQMCVTQTGDLPGQVSVETAVNIVDWAVRSAIRYKGIDATIDTVYEFLREFPKNYDDYDLLCKEEREVCHADFALVGAHLAFNLSKFTSDGPYGKWFNGENNFDISKDDFVVLELEELKQFKDLFNVITLAVMYFVTLDLYLSDRRDPRLIIFDEAWQFLQDSKAFQDVIEEGYRRARKYFGSFGIVTQDVLDLKRFGRVGDVINSNAAFKFYLESGSFARAADEKLLPFKDDNFLLKLIETIKYNSPKYSEIFVYSDSFGCGVMRLMVDPYSYFIYTTNPAEVRLIEELVSEGRSYDEVISKLAEFRKKGIPINESSLTELFKER